MMVFLPKIIALRALSAPSLGAPKRFSDCHATGIITPQDAQISRFFANEAARAGKSDVLNVCGI
jgi:hypothetical protein